MSIARKIARRKPNLPSKDFSFPSYPEEVPELKQGEVFYHVYRDRKYTTADAVTMMLEHGRWFVPSKAPVYSNATTKIRHYASTATTDNQDTSETSTASAPNRAMEPYECWVRYVNGQAQLQTQEPPAEVWKWTWNEIFIRFHDGVGSPKLPSR